MRTLTLLLCAAIGVMAATRKVCLSGCEYQSWQAAVAVAVPGDTIVGEAGQNLGSITLPGGTRDLTFKSSAVDRWPRGYRIARDSSMLARTTQVTIGDNKLWTRSVAPDTLAVVAAGNSAFEIAHGLKVGDRVVTGSGLYSALHCGSLNQAPYGAICNASRIGYISIRSNNGLANGMAVYFRARPSVPLPPPLRLNTPYYVRDYTPGGATASELVSNPHKFRIAETPGGPALDITPFDPAGRDFNVEVPAYPARRGDVLFVVDVPDAAGPDDKNGRRLKLSFTSGGAPIVWQQMPYGYDGGSYSAGMTLTRFRRAENITFDGVEVFPNADTDAFYPFYMISGSGPGTMDAETRGIRILRCWIHAKDDQETFPHAMIRFGARDVEIGWSILEGAYSTGNDTQIIGANSSTGGVYVHDNLIKGATQGFFASGGFPDFAPDGNLTGVRIVRNYFLGLARAYRNLSAVRLSNTQFAFASNLSSGPCDTAAANGILGHHCFWQEGDDEIPEASNITRYEWSQNTANSTFTVTGSSAGQKGYVYGLNGQLYMRHNFSGSVTCPSGVTCIADPTRFFPAGSTRIGIAVLGAGGVFDSAFYQEFRPMWSKARIESKGMDNALIEGNVLQRQDNCDGGSACQNNLIQYTIAGNGSGAGQPMHYAVSSSHALIRNNVLRHAASAVTFNGRTFNFAFPENGAYTCLECSGFGKATANRFENNLMYDIGSSEHTFGNNPTMGLTNSPTHIVFSHNTAADVFWGFNCGGCRYLEWSGNVLTPYRSACVGTEANCQSRDATGHPGVRFSTSIVFPSFSGESLYTFASQVSAASSTFVKNLTMNRAGFWFQSSVPTYYPSPTYLVQYTDSGRDPAVLFSSWNERADGSQPNGRNYLANNFRLASGKCGAYPAKDSRCIGADIDEIEALTGPLGDDVVRGIPTFAERTGRRIQAGSVTATLSYIPGAAQCTVRVWNNSSYSGTPALDLNEAGAVVSEGRVYLTLTGLTPATAWYGKRWCGSSVDVFRFTTSAATTTPAVLFSLAAAPAAATHCAAQYGSTTALGSETAPAAVSAARSCTVSVPAGNYFRHVWKNGSQVVASSQILFSSR